MSWNLSPQELFDAKYLPSLWIVQKIALRALLDAILGPITIQAIMIAPKNVHKSFANAPRKRPLPVKYPRKLLF